MGSPAARGTKSLDEGETFMGRDSAGRLMGNNRVVVSNGAGAEPSKTVKWWSVWRRSKEADSSSLLHKRSEKWRRLKASPFWANGGLRSLSMAVTFKMNGVGKALYHTYLRLTWRMLIETYLARLHHLLHQHGEAQTDIRSGWTLLTNTLLDQTR